MRLITFVLATMTVTQIASARTLELEQCVQECAPGSGPKCMVWDSMAGDPIFEILSTIYVGAQSKTDKTIAQVCSGREINLLSGKIVSQGQDDCIIAMYPDRPQNPRLIFPPALLGTVKLVAGTKGKSLVFSDETRAPYLKFEAAGIELAGRVSAIGFGKYMLVIAASPGPCMAFVK